MIRFSYFASWFETSVSAIATIKSGQDASMYFPSRLIILPVVFLSNFWYWGAPILPAPRPIGPPLFNKSTSHLRFAYFFVFGAVIYEIIVRACTDDFAVF